MVVCLAVSAIHGQPPSPPIVPAGTFHLAAISQGERVSDFAAASTGLYFLINRDRTSEPGSKIVQTALQGTVRNVIAVPGGPNHAIAADDHGNLAVYRSDDRGQALLLFDARGLHVATLTPPGPVRSFAVKQDKAAWIAWDGSVMQAEPASGPRILFKMDPVSAPLTLFWPGENKLLAIDRVSGELVLIDAATRSVKRARPAAPEISAAVTQNRARNTGDGVGLAISASALYEGDVFALLSPYKTVEGAPVLRIGEKGRVLRSIRCLLPAAEGHGRMLSPVAIGLHKSMLVLVDNSGAVAVYAL